MVNRKLIVYATVEVILEVPEDMTDEQAVEEFYNNTSVTMDETVNLGIFELELIDVNSDGPDEEDLEDEFYGSNTGVAKIDDFTDEEFNALPLYKQQELIRNAM